MTPSRPEKITLQALREAASAEQKALELAKKSEVDPTMGNMLLGAFALPIAFIVIATSTHEWVWIWDLLFGIGAYLVTIVAVGIGWGVVEPKNDKQMIRPWLVTSVVLAGLWGWLFDPPGATAVIAALPVVYALFQAYVWPSAPQKDESAEALDAKAGLWGLPTSVVQLVPQLPEAMPEAETRVIEDALEDYIHLVEAACDLSVEQEAALQPLRREAAATVREMMVHAHKVATLHRLASQRLDDDGAKEAAAAAMARLERMGAGLQQAASAAIRYMASSDRAAAGELLELSESLRLQGAVAEEMRAVVGERG